MKTVFIVCIISLSILQATCEGEFFVQITPEIAFTTQAITIESKDPYARKSYEAMLTATPTEEEVKAAQAQAQDQAVSDKPSMKRRLTCTIGIEPPNKFCCWYVWWWY